MKGTKEMDAVLIPAYKPDNELPKLTADLARAGFKVLVIDDGSGKEYREIFEKAEQWAVVVHAPENEGKGAALKRGILAVGEFFPECTYFITADADGQHTVSDILRVRDKLHAGDSFVLTLRDFRGKIPKKSLLGNRLSKIVYTVLTGHYLADNQSGLRGFSAEYADWLSKVPGKRYDYEINVLFYAEKQHIRMGFVPIASIYFNDNQASHFHPVFDTLRIYRSLFSSARATFFAGAAYAAEMILIAFFWGYRYCYATVLIAGLCAALVGTAVDRAVFSGVRYLDGGRMLLNRTVRTVVYTAVCVLFGRFAPFIPILPVFAVAALLFLPVSYFAFRLLAKVGK